MKAALLIFLFCLAEADDLRHEVKALFQQLKSDLEAQNADMASRLSASETKIEELVEELQKHKAAHLAQLSAIQTQVQELMMFVKVNGTETKLEEDLLLPVTVHSAACCDLDCEEIYNNVSTQSGVYNIYPTTTPAKVYCDMDTDGGKWTVIQRRVDGTVNFYRHWAQYKDGFGDASGEYWLGLENMHLLTKNTTYQLRVDMEDFFGSTAFASYSSFSVGSEADGYRLQVAGFQNGGAGDSLTSHNGMKFSTFDKDQDTAGENCASKYYGAFWYTACHYANPNGVYLWGQTAHSATGVVWYHWKGYQNSLKAVAMKIRRVP